MKRDNIWVFISLAMIAVFNMAVAEANPGFQGVELQETQKSESGQAKMNLGFFGVGGRLGFVDPEGDIESTISFGFHADMGTITPTLGLEGNIDYWSKSQDRKRGGYEYEWKNRDLSLGATVKYRFPTQGSISPYAGGGLGFHMVKEEKDYERESPYEDRDESGIHLGLHGVGGAEMLLSPNMRGGVEVRYTLNDPSNLGIFLGVMYLLKP